MHKNDLHTIANLLEPHAIFRPDHEKPHFIGPQFLSVAESKLSNQDIESFKDLPSSIYDGAEMISVNGKMEAYHVFLRSGLERVLGSNWQSTGRGV